MNPAHVGFNVWHGRSLPAAQGLTCRHRQATKRLLSWLGTLSMAGKSRLVCAPGAVIAMSWGLTWRDATMFWLSQTQPQAVPAIPCS